MLRKIMAIAALATVVASAACNTITATDEGGTKGRNIEPIRTPQQGDVGKVCVEELRAVAINSPSETERVQDGQLLMVSWEAQEICGSHYASVRVSTDGGQTFSLLGETKSATSMAWRLARVAGARLVIDVTVTDAHGTVSDRVALEQPVAAAPGGGGPRPPVTAD